MHGACYTLQMDQKLSPGQVFSRLIVVRKLPQGWLCRCSCGKQVVTYQCNLRLGRVKSCGCLKIEIDKTARLTHGDSRRGRIAREYRIWAHARRRCIDKKENGYENYGGRGIKICDKWLNSYESFLSDMGRCPPKHTLERLDYDGDYCPENCVWATYKKQGNNRRDNIIVECRDGSTITLTQASEKLALPYHSLQRARKSIGLSPIEAVRYIWMKKYDTTCPV